MKKACLTLEAALEQAIQQEEKSVALHPQALKTLKKSEAKALAKFLALEESDHKHTLEKSMIEETLVNAEVEQSRTPTMDVVEFLEERELDKNATAQDVLVFAIHEEKRSVDFYKEMAVRCDGAPMQGVFSKLEQDELRHLTRLERIYEKLFLSTASA